MDNYRVPKGPKEAGTLLWVEVTQGTTVPRREKEFLIIQFLKVLS